MTINARHRKHYKAGAVSPDMGRMKHPPRRAHRVSGERVDITDAFEELGTNYGLAPIGDYPAGIKRRNIAGRLFQRVKKLLKVK